MSEHSTGISCPLCKEGEIVAKVIPSNNSLEQTIDSLAPWNPSLPSFVVKSFHCNNCQVVYNHPPSKPNAAEEILSSLATTKV